MDNIHAIAKLDELSHAGKLFGDFGHSLIQQYNKKHDLSEKQWYWVHKLVADAEAPAPEMDKERVGDFTGVIELFTKAKGNLKYPKISLTTESGGTVMLSLAGSQAAKPGTINVTDGKAYGHNIWYGRVDDVGNWEKSTKATEEVGNLLKDLSLDPAGFATNYGHKHGSCCFCNKTLTHENSVTAGFGPVCADNWGLSTEWKAAAK